MNEEVERPARKVNNDVESSVPQRSAKKINNTVETSDRSTRNSLQSLPTSPKIDLADQTRRSSRLISKEKKGNQEDDNISSKVSLNLNR